MELTPTYQHVPRLAAGSAESVEHLESEGFVVIAAALDPEQTVRAVDLTWDFLEGLGTGIDRDYPLWRYCLWARHNETVLGGSARQLAALGERIAAGDASCN